jgi:hypothetical protein
MCGKNCVAIASDLRFGINQQQTTAVDMKKIYEIHPHLYVGLSGASRPVSSHRAGPRGATAFVRAAGGRTPSLEDGTDVLFPRARVASHRVSLRPTWGRSLGLDAPRRPRLTRAPPASRRARAGLAADAVTLAQKFAFRHNLYKLREGRDMRPETFANVVSTMLYEKRFGPYYAEPVVAGLGASYAPVPVRPRRRGARRSSRTFAGAARRPGGSPGFNPDTPRRLTTPPLTSLNATPISSLVRDAPQTR